MLWTINISCMRKSQLVRTAEGNKTKKEDKSWDEREWEKSSKCCRLSSFFYSNWINLCKDIRFNITCPRLIIYPDYRTQFFCVCLFLERIPQHVLRCTHYPESWIFVQGGSEAGGEVHCTFWFDNHKNVSGMSIVLKLLCWWWSTDQVQSGPSTRHHYQHW